VCACVRPLRELRGRRLLTISSSVRYLSSFYLIPPSARAAAAMPHPLALPGAETTSVPPPVGERLLSVGGVPVPRTRVPTPNSGAHGTRKQNAIQ